MNKMVFLSSWQNLASAWSGTPFGLYSALRQKTDTELLECYERHGKIERAMNVLSMGLLSLGKYKKAIHNSHLPAGVPLLCFGEYDSRHIGSTYCYQDLSVDYLLRLRKAHHPAARYGLRRAVPSWVVRIKQAQANRFYRRCAGVFTMSEWLRNDLIQHTGLPEAKVHHVGGGCNIDVSKIDCSRKRGRRFLFVGRDWDRKNGELVVSAFKKLTSSHPEWDAELYIAGPVTQPKSTVGQERISYLGRLTHEELVDCYNNCDYFVMPSKFEAYGLVFAESLCFGLPCIGKNICAMPEFIQHGTNGLLIENDDSDELADAMEKMLTHGPEMARFVQEHRAFYIREYSWDSVANRILQAIHRTE